MWEALAHRVPVFESIKVVRYSFYPLQNNWLFVAAESLGWTVRV